jgi:DNA invertase Pin-like site-specific DNA recombinase
MPVKMKRAGLYVRVSTGEQRTESQERSLREYAARRGWKVHKIYRDEGLSGVSTTRPALHEMLRDCRRGSIDVLLVWKFDRLARSLNALVSCLEMCRSLGIDFVSVTESVDTSLPAGELMFQLIGAVAQFERSLIAERVRAGLANARANGKVLGRPPLRKMTRTETAELRRLRRQSRVPFRELAKKFGVSIWIAHRLCMGRGSRSFAVNH